MKRKSNVLVWFQLADAVTGEAYKGVTADYVSLSSNDFIAKFRDAVKAKFPNKLSSVDASDLMVYKNREAFEERYDQEEKVMHLSLIAGRAVGSRLVC